LAAKERSFASSLGLTMATTSGPSVSGSEATLSWSPTAALSSGVSPTGPVRSKIVRQRAESKRESAVT
jgi:hypothetical protein